MGPRSDHRQRRNFCNFVFKGRLAKNHLSCCVWSVYLNLVAMTKSQNFTDIRSHKLFAANMKNCDFKSCRTPPKPSPRKNVHLKRFGFSAARTQIPYGAVLCVYVCEILAPFAVSGPSLTGTRTWLVTSAKWGVRNLRNFLALA